MVFFLRINKKGVLKNPTIGSKTPASVKIKKAFLKTERLCLITHHCVWYKSTLNITSKKYLILVTIYPDI